MTKGTIDNPVQFSEAITSDRVIPGDVLLLREGTYTADTKGTIEGSNAPGKGVFRIKLHGTVENKITIKPYPGEHVRINGGIEIIDGSYIRLQNLEIAPTPTTRTFETTQDVDYPAPLYISAPGCEVVNCYVHDGDDGSEIMNAPHSKVYGNVFHNNGIYVGGRRGYNIYTHNNTGGDMSIKHNIFVRPFSEASIHVYSPNNLLLDYYIDENVLTDAGLTLGGDQRAANNHFNHNHVYNTNVRAGVSYVSAYEDVEISNNYLHNSSLHIWWFKDVSALGNTVSALLPNMANVLYKDHKDGPGIINFNNNAYCNPLWNTSFGYNDGNGDVWYSFAQWQGMGHDSNSTFTQASPTGTQIFYYPNEYKNLNINDPLYDPHVGLLSISNHDGLNAVNVNIPDLDIGRSYKLCNGTNYGSEYQEFTYVGSSISVQMTGWTVAIPTAWEIPNSDSPYPLFGCFMLIAS